MGHFASILFFTALLAALATILDLIVRSDWGLISSALRFPSRPRKGSLRPAAMLGSRRPAAS